MSHLPKYEFVEIPGDESHWGISIDNEIVIQVKQLSFEEKKDSCIMHFNYVIISGEINHDKYPKIEQFKHTIGDILVKIMAEEQLMDNTSKKDHNDSS